LASKITTVAAILVVAALVVGVALAVTHWAQTIGWNMQNESFTVSGANTSVDLGIVAVGTQHVETYTVTNNGNTAITVQVSTTGSGFTASWNATSATLNSNGDKAGFELTLTVNGAGSCTVSIDLV